MLPRMPIRLRAFHRVAWPPLAWAARIGRDGGVVLFAGDAVERTEDGLLAAAWSGPYASTSPFDATTSIGTALRLLPGRIEALCGNAGHDVLFLHRGGKGVVLANGLPIALAAAGDAPLPHYPFYNHDLMAYLAGAAPEGLPLPLRRGTLTPFYRGIALAGPGWQATPLPPRAMPRWPDFAAYRAMLVAETRALFANAADPARRRRYAPIATISSGYDSVAAAVIARDAGCTEALTWRQASMAEPGTLDSGEESAARLGLAAAVLPTHAYRARSDLPEAEFIAAGYGGPQVMMAGSEPHLAERLIVTGFAGDMLWDRDAAPRPGPAICGGFSALSFHLRLPALAVAVPMIGAADDPSPLGALSRAAEMAPWTLGGGYDRPIPRRIAEEAGLPRGSFAQRKRMATPAYATLGRHRLPVEGFLSEHSAARFRAWLAAHGGIERRAAWRNRLVAPLARLFWTGALPRLMGRAGLSWPPAPRALWRLRHAVRDSALLFQWAMEVELPRLVAALDTALRTPASWCGPGKEKP
jgi:hypothetical protein